MAELELPDQVLWLALWGVSLGRRHLGERFVPRLLFSPRYLPGPAGDQLSRTTVATSTPWMPLGRKGQLNQVDRPTAPGLTYQRGPKDPA